MKNLMAEQITNTNTNIIIQRTYKIADYKYENVKETWTPRLKFFKPPTIYLFRWAYHIDSITVHSDKPLKMEIVMNSKSNQFTTITEFNKEE